MSLASLREKLKILQIQSANNQGKGSETPSSRNVLQAASTNATNTPAPTQNVRYIGSEQKVCTHMDRSEGREGYLAPNCPYIVFAPMAARSLLCGRERRGAL